MKNSNFKLFKKTILVTFLLLLFVFIFNVKAQENEKVSDQTDAIAVKIIPNPNHYSISTWYKKQGFFGSPQSLVVDGYEAIRDGRTVYVNAANVSDNNIYTNIYVISYSQEPSEKTVDILGQIVSRWEFNDNLNEEFSEEPYTCSVSSLTCDSDEDCQDDQYCSDSGATIGTCLLTENKNCLIDSDCPSNYFCDSPKAMVIRDTKRIGMLEEMKVALNNYFSINSYYPKLQSGTYLANKTISVWPSWQDRFLADLAISPTYIDSINRIGNCPGFNKDTCWNIEEKRFFSNPQYEMLTLPDNSYVMVYASNPEGSRYNLCSSLETPSIGFQFYPGDYNQEACLTNFTISGGTGENISPSLVDYYLEAQSGRELNGYIRLKDPNNDSLNWNLITDSSNWTGWSTPPRLIDTSSNFEKKIFAEKTALTTGDPYTVRLQVDDGHGGIFEQEFEIIIKEPGIFIEAENSNHTLKVGSVFNYSFYFSGETLPENAEDISYSVIKVSGPDDINPTFFHPVGTGVPELVANNKYKVSYSGEIIPEDFPNGEFAEDVRLGFRITVSDINNRQFTKDFYIDIVSPKPPLDFSCPLATRINTEKTGDVNKYSCAIGKKTYLDDEVEYSFSGLDVFGEFNLNYDGFLSDTVYLEGYPNYNDIAEVTITAKSPFGAEREKSFNLKVNSYCGDGYLQSESPNTEGKGGLYNDGYEICEGNLGVALSASESNIDFQYGCTTVNSNTPLEINNSNYCVFKDSYSGGGYCGDYVCQTSKEDDASCPIDCDDSSDYIESNDCNSDEECEAGYLCSMLTGKCVVDLNYCDEDDQCGLGLVCGEENKCEPECWTKNEVVATVDFKQGDANIPGEYSYREEKLFGITSHEKITFNASQINDNYYNTYERTKDCDYNKSKEDCTTVSIDNAYCNNMSFCPKGFGTTFYLIGKAGDKCYRGSNDWPNRNIYECRKKESVERCFSDPCRTNTIVNSRMTTVFDGRIDANGNCVKY